MIEEIRLAMIEAKAAGQTLAMFHYLVLKNADALETQNAKSFCLAVGVVQGYANEFSQMMALNRVMRQKGTRLASA